MLFFVTVRSLIKQDYATPFICFLKSPCERIRTFLLEKFTNFFSKQCHSSRQSDYFVFLISWQRPGVASLWLEPLLTYLCPIIIRLCICTLDFLSAAPDCYAAPAVRLAHVSTSEKFQVSACSRVKLFTVTSFLSLLPSWSPHQSTAADSIVYHYAPSSVVIFSSPPILEPHPPPAYSLPAPNIIPVSPGPCASPVHSLPSTKSFLKQLSTQLPASNLSLHLSFLISATKLFNKSLILFFPSQCLFFGPEIIENFTVLIQLGSLCLKGR